MADKIKRISINAFEEAINSFYIPTTTVEWNGLSVVVKRHLNLAEVARFVDVCAKACFNKDDDSYAPEAKDLAIRSCIISFYTNITLPANLEKQYDLIYHSTILEAITPNLDQTQLNAIIRAVEEKVEYITDTNVSYLKQQIDELYNAIGGFQKQMEDVFGDIGEGDVKDVINAIANGSLDEEKIVKAYLSKNQ